MCFAIPLRPQTKIVILPPVNTGNPDLSWMAWAFSTSWSLALSADGFVVTSQDSIFRELTRNDRLKRWFSVPSDKEWASQGPDIVVGGFFYLRDDTLRLSLRSYDAKTNRISPVRLMDCPFRDFKDAPSAVERGFLSLATHLRENQGSTINVAEASKLFALRIRPASFLRDNIRAWMALGYQDAAESGAATGNRLAEKKWLVTAEKLLSGTNFSLGRKAALLAGLSAFDKGQFSEASLHLEAYLREVPDDVYAVTMLARCHRASGRMQDAVRLLRHAAELDPVNLEVQGELGDLFVELKQYDEARKLYENVVGADPVNARAYCGLGIVTLNSKKKKHAADYFEKALAIDSLHSRANYELGLLLAKKKKTRDEARVCLERFLRLDPRNANAEAVRKLLASWDKKK